MKCVYGILFCASSDLWVTQTNRKVQRFCRKRKTERQKEQIKAWIANELLMKGQAEIWSFSAEAHFLHYTLWEARSVCVCGFDRDTWNWNDALCVQMHEHYHSIPHYFPKFKQKSAGFHSQWQLFKLTFDLLCKKKEKEKNQDSATECLREFLAFCPHSSLSFFCSVSNSLSFQKVRNLRLSIRLHVKEQVRPKSQG